MCGISVKFSRASVQTHLHQHSNSIDDYETEFGKPELHEFLPHNLTSTESTEALSGTEPPQALSGTEPPQALSGTEPPQAVSAHAWLPVPPINHPIGPNCVSKGEKN